MMYTQTTRQLDQEDTVQGEELGDLRVGCICIDWEESETIVEYFGRGIEDKSEKLKWSDDKEAVIQ